jgi:FdhE protein
MAMKRPDWDKRIRRAGELGERFSYAADILAFYGQVLEFQNTIYRAISSQPPGYQAGGSFRQGLQIDAVLRYLPGLLSLVEQSGTSKLAEQAKEIRTIGTDQQRSLIETSLLVSEKDERESDEFFARVLLQPCAEHLASGQPAQPAGSAGSVCPICGARPQAAVLRPEGDGGKRFLLCSFCLTEFDGGLCSGARGSLRHLPLLS